MFCSARCAGSGGGVPHSRGERIEKYARGRPTGYPAVTRTIALSTPQRPARNPLFPGVVAAIALSMLAPSADAGERRDRCAAAAPLRIANLSPFHLAYATPASFGACALEPGATEAILSMDMASHMTAARSASERLSLDGETWRPSLALRHGLGEGWDYTIEVSAVTHNGGVFDGFIESWHSVFGLPQGGRDETPRDRLRIAWARDGHARVDIDRAAACCLLI